MTIVKYQDLNNTVDKTAEKAVVKILVVKNFICNEFIHGGHLLSLGTVAIALSTMILLDVMVRWEFLLIVYLGTLIIYNHDHYKEFEMKDSNNILRTNHLKKYHKERLLILAIYGFGFFALLFYFGSIESIIFGILLLLTGVFYTGTCKNLTKRIIGLKNYYTAMSISLTALFTAIYCSYAINLLLIIFIVFLFLRFLINTSFCDIKDIIADKKQNLLTWPIYWGKKKFLSVLHVINIISVILLVISMIMRITPLFSIFLLFSFLYTFYYIRKAKTPTSDIQSISSILVDGEFIFWPFLLFFGRMII